MRLSLFSSIIEEYISEIKTLVMWAQERAPKMLKKSNQKGFSIIEVLIVLAIAGLIMLIVFLAVPALQRNSRNSQRKSDVTAAIGSLQEAISNNNGKLPSSVSAGIGNGKYAVFDTGDFTGSLSNTTAVATVNSTDAGVVITNFSKCGAVPAAGTAAMPTDGAGATKRSITAVYRVETAGNFQVQCLDM